MVTVTVQFRLVASGGDGNYSYTCSNGMVGDSLINVCAGIHTIWVIDGLGCQAVDTVTVLEPAVIIEYNFFCCSYLWIK